MYFSTGGVYSPRPRTANLRAAQAHPTGHRPGTRPPRVLPSASPRNPRDALPTSRNRVSFTGRPSVSTVPSRLCETSFAIQSLSKKKRPVNPIQFANERLFAVCEMVMRFFQPAQFKTIAHSTHARNTHWTTTMSTRILNEVGGKVTERGCIFIVVRQDSSWMHHDAAALLLRQVRGQSEKPLCRSFGFVRTTHDRTA